MSFEENLSKGQFLIPKCTQCKKIIWPSSDYCSYCFGKIELKKQDFEAKIVEFSKKNDDYFCLVEIENSFRIIAKTYQTPTIGKIVSISKCGIKDRDYFFEIN
ncbi:hypothetical protein [Nitrosopumilus sp.]|uniref:zinc ribbon domain-containing protein n=1 Tax=Nitrosopumilus sp. TaxID=2024843 RepID=UPI00261E6125|nr:hypothetical protein [Nitrosopumilus sp.]